LPSDGEPGRWAGYHAGQQNQPAAAHPAFRSPHWHMTVQQKAAKGHLSRSRDRAGSFVISALLAIALIGVVYVFSPAEAARPPGGQSSSSAGAPPVVFTDVTRASGINFVNFKGNQGTSTLLEEAGPGVCVGDFDSDGFVDFYIVNGRDLYGRGIKVQNALYHNKGDGSFEDVTDSAGVPGTLYGLGCVWGDYDNDGRPDLYVTQYGKNILYHNEGNGKFKDVTEEAHVDGMDFGTVFHTGAAFFDYDRDGRLDLYVGGYASFGPTSQRNCDIGGGVMSSCLPAMYGGTPAVLYHNNGDGTFSNVTKAAGLWQPEGINLAVQAADYDNDGWPDLFVSNDGIPAYLYHNNHDGTFKEMGMMSGMAMSAEGNTMAAMCMSLGDYDHDGFEDVYISDFQMVPDHLWHNDGKGYFDEVSDAAGIGEFTNQVLSFGGGFLDYDNDGWLDIFIANGSVYPEIARVSSEIKYKQFPILFHNDHNGRFTNVSGESGDGFKHPLASRGVAFADFDNDGNVDIVVANSGDPPLLLHNGGCAGRHFITFRLVGKRSNRDAMGAKVRILAGAVRQILEVKGAGSYLSQSDLRAHFGLDSAERVESVEVTWPSGLSSTYRNVPADKFYVIQEGSQRMEQDTFKTK
jgi:enediyne biosynthesis protein E4